MIQKILKILREQKDNPNIEECINGLRALKKTDKTQFSKLWLENRFVIEMLIENDRKIINEIVKYLSEEDKSKS